MSENSLNYSGCRVLVTGGAGFIGSHLVDALLAHGCERVVAVDNLFLGKLENLEDAQATGERFKLYRQDASERTAMEAIIEKEKPDIVFNLATKALLYSFFNPSGACSVNLDIALVLAELLRRDTYRRLVHVSTSEVYGSARELPMPETHPLMAETTYAAGKAAADLALISYYNQYQLNLSIVRPFNNYGPRQNDGDLAAVIPLTVKRILNRDRPVIEGDGMQTRDFIYVMDTVTGLMNIAMSDTKTRGQIYNLASGVETPIRDIINSICKHLDYDGEMESRPGRVADVRRHAACTEKIRGVIGQLSLTKLDKGMGKTIDWYLAKNRQP